MPSVKIANGKGLFCCLRNHGGPKERNGCETMVPSAKEDTESSSTVIAADSPIDRSFQTCNGAPVSPNRSGRSALSEDKKSKDLDDMPRFFYEEEAHEDSPYVTIFSDH